MLPGDYTELNALKKIIMDLASCSRLLLKTQYFFTVLLCNPYKNFMQTRKHGKKLIAIKRANVRCPQVGEGQWVLGRRYSFDRWGPDRFFSQSWDILRAELCWSSLEIFSRLSSWWLEQNCSSLLSLDLYGEEQAPLQLQAVSQGGWQRTGSVCVQGLPLSRLTCSSKAEGSGYCRVGNRE